MRVIPVISIAAALLAVTAPVSVAKVNAPPGNSGISQYLEVVPDSSGNKPSTGNAPKKVLAVKVQHELEQAGPSGTSLVKFASGTAPSAKRTGKIEVADTKARSAAVASTVLGTDGSTGMGFLLPVLMAAAAAVALFAGWRRRSADDEDR